MNKVTVLFGILLYLVLVNARHYGERIEADRRSDDENEESLRVRDHSGVNKHRRRRWQMNYGYDYHQPPNPYYPDRRDYDRTQDLIPQIFKLLDEISTNLRRNQAPPPPPPPQPIYIPYPVPYFVPRYIPCRPQGSKTPNITKRVNNDIPGMEDTNQIWGVYAPIDNAFDYEDGSDGGRPIDFNPVKPKAQMVRPSPPVEHGSTQESISDIQSARSPDSQNSASFTTSTMPDLCQAAVLSCCGTSGNSAKQKECFTTLGCSVTYRNGKACDAESIARVLDSFKLTYSPVN